MLECQSRQGILVFRLFPNKINTEKNILERHSLAIN